uniref:Uncharacterized protein n=1 Tax=Trichogramma kaykai TaxID=54128 RepID=A0ABD2XHI9_9HYME
MKRTRTKRNAKKKKTTASTANCGAATIGGTYVGAADGGSWMRVPLAEWGRKREGWLVYLFQARLERVARTPIAAIHARRTM